jgi:Cu2+-exporting ATPase
VARILVLAALTAVGWSIADPARAFNATLAVLVVSCPCAFALAVPAALTRSLGVLAKRGVLVVRPDAVEKLAGATHVLFDKTGTLTVPALDVEHVEVMRQDEESRVLGMAAALARSSRHPIARAIAAAVPPPAYGVAPYGVDDVRVINGAGIEGSIEGRRLRLGQRDFAAPGASDPRLTDEAVVLADEAGPIASFTLKETIRGGAKDLIEALKAAKLSIALISGDASAKVHRVADALGIERWYARQRPDDKLARLTDCRAPAACVVAIGDGINDAPLLAAADVGVTLAAGADIAHATSDIILVGERLDGLLTARGIACDTLRILRQNQRWALFYNCAAVPAAAFGFVPPWAAAIGMSASSLIVILNALRIGKP